ncbi:MAG: hypothetical protein R2911_34450 [Caldilineaceae bacterium]
MDQTITFFYQPNRRRRSELAFFESVKNFHPQSQTVNQHFMVNADLVHQFVDVKKLVDWLAKDSYLPNRSGFCVWNSPKNFP